MFERVFEWAVNGEEVCLYYGAGKKKEKEEKKKEKDHGDTSLPLRGTNPSAFLQEVQKFLSKCPKYCIDPSS